jgi:CheY-like chemotaxis protein
MTRRRQTILVVEGEPGLSKAYQNILNTAGYAVTSVSNNPEAVRRAADPEPMLILLDLGVPGTGNASFLRRYRLRQEHPSVKVIVLGNYNVPDEIDEAFRLGADRFMIKAFASPKELSRLVHATLAEPKAV